MLQAAIVDTPIFQRLRYIKQNGLLHFVFPGAVHTRFGHSIGTMHLAARVFRSLFPDYSSADPSGGSGKALQYIGQVFQTAALLHDCGHMAFSHAIEHVRLNDKPLVRPLTELAEEWSDTTLDLKTWLTDRTSKGELQLAPTPTHEELGLLFIGILFGGLYQRVPETCRRVLDVDPALFADDVRALIKPTLPTSAVFDAFAGELGYRLDKSGAIDPAARPAQLKNALSALISGTIDVDRMDYLIRDSRFTGTLYGICDVGLIIDALELCVGESGGPIIALGLRKRACQAVDDFLWSRYQLFAQVLNHKTNVILNAMLAKALEDAFASSSIPLGQPKTLEEHIEFTDDLVMSSVIRGTLTDAKRHKRSYYRALVGRDLPLYLGRMDVTDAANAEALVAAKAQYYAKEVLNDPSRSSEIQHWGAESALIKGTGLPFVLEVDKVRGVDRPPKGPGEEDTYQLHGWNIQERIPANIEHVHFFIDRDLLDTHISANEG